MQASINKVINLQPHYDCNNPITQQPAVVNSTRIQHPRELKINGLITRLDQRKLVFFKATDNYLAYSQQVYYPDNLLNFLLCCKASYSELNSGNQLTVVYPNKTIENIQINKSLFASKNISFNSNDRGIIALDNSGENSKLYLIKLKSSEQSLTKTANFAISHPKEKISAASIDSDDRIYTTVIEKGSISIWNASIEDNSNTLEANNWNKIDINLPSNLIVDTSFSKNSRFLFVRLNNDDLYVFDGKADWSEIAKLSKITDFPVDIDETTKSMIFIKGKQLIIKNVTDSILFYDEFSNKITTAYFIPNTKDFLIFDSAGIISLVKFDADKYTQSKNYPQIKLQHRIEEAYFNPEDNTKLIALTKKITHKLIKEECLCSDDFTTIGTIVASCIVCFTGECCSLTCLLTLLYGCSTGCALDILFSYIDIDYFCNDFIIDLKNKLSHSKVVRGQKLLEITAPATNKITRA